MCANKENKNNDIIKFSWKTVSLSRKMDQTRNHLAGLR